MKPLERKGWKIYFHPIFDRQYQDLKDKVIKLNNKLDKEKLVIHSDVKLFQTIINLIDETIPSDPFAHYFVLTDSLKKYSRVKKKGLPNRYRLFFKVFKEERKIVVLWLGYPRKEGDKKDCYNIFSNMVARGKFPMNIDELIN